MGVGLKLSKRCPFGLLARLSLHGGERAGSDGLRFTFKGSRILD